MQFTFIIIVLLSTIGVSAQSNLLMTESFCDWNGETFDKLPYKEIQYIYDEEEVLIEEVEFENIDTISGLDTSRITTYYPGTDLVKSLMIKEQRYGPATVLKEYEYVNESCLLSEKKYRYRESEENWFHYYTAFYDPMTCRIDSVVRYNQEYLQIYLYEYTNDSLKIYEYFNTIDNPRHFYSYEVFGESNELLLKIVRTDIFDRYEYEYNEYGDIEKMTYSAAGIGDSIYELDYEYLYDYDYGPNGEKYRETKAEIWYYSASSIDTFVYTQYFEFPMEEEFYCDGLLKSTQCKINKEGLYENSTLKKYAYAFGENCSETEMTVNVFPNPNNGLFYLQSDLLEKSEVAVELVSLAGKPLFATQVPERISTVTVDLSFLPRGIYVLSLTSDEWSISKKIHIVD